MIPLAQRQQSIGPWVKKPRSSTTPAFTAVHSLLKWPSFGDHSHMTYPDDDQLRFGTGNSCCTVTVWLKNSCDRRLNPNKTYAEDDQFKTGFQILDISVESVDSISSHHLVYVYTVYIYIYIWPRKWSSHWKWTNPSNFCNWWLLINSKGKADLTVVSVQLP